MRAPKLVVIVGPTGVGKTAAAIALARRYNGELVGADSVQIYRGFDIGSGKPTPAELGEIRHHLIDSLAGDEPADAGRYAELADTAIEDIAARGKLPIVVGGTGLWLRALLRGLVALPAPDAELRAALDVEWCALGDVAMHARLREVDPTTALTVHVHDKLRVLRALEVHAQTGQPLGELRHAHALGAPRYCDWTCFIDLPLAHYAEQISARTRGMLQAGLVDEVTRLRAQHPDNIRAFGSIGYRQVIEASARAQSAEVLEQNIARATLKYARRQRTWFKSDPCVAARMTPQELLAEPGRKAIEKHLA